METTIITIHTIMKKYLKYLCVFLMILGTYAPARGAVYQKVTDVSQLSTGDVVILTNNIASTGSGQAMSKTVSGQFYGQVAVETSSSNKITYSGSDAMVLTVKLNGSGLIAFWTGSGWLYDDGSNNHLKVNSGNWSDGLASSANWVWGIALSSGSNPNKCIDLLNEYARKEKSNRWLQYNSSGFKSSSTYGTYANLCIWKVSCTMPTVAFANPTSYTLSYGDSWSYGAKTATVKYNGSSTGQTISYSSNNTGVASVNSSTGAITLGGSCGTATITASAAANATYCDASATYTITVNPVCPTLIKDALAAASITSTTASLSGGKVTNKGGANITQYGFVYGTSANPTIGNANVHWSSDIATNTAFGSKSISNLSPNTTYHVRVFATNSANTCYSDAEITFTTLQRYTITYYKNDGSAATIVNYKDHGVNTTLLNASNSFTRSGYTLTKWNTNSTGTGSDKTLGSSYTTNENIDLYAVWTPKNYTITLNNQSATTAGTASISVTYDANTNLTGTPAITVPTKTGYTFGGYYTGTNGSGTQIIAANGNVNASAGGGSTYTDGSKNWKYANNIELYAKWTAATYDVTLDREGATTGSTSVTMTYNSSSHTAITNPAKDGFQFAGYWTGDNGEGTMVINTSGVLQANVDGYTGAGGIWIRTTATTLYAKWVTLQGVSVDNVDHVTIYATPAGSSNINENGNASVLPTTTVTLHYSSVDDGYFWGGWSVTKTSDGTAVSVTGSGDGATFTMPDYAVTVSANLYGEIVAWCTVPVVTLTGGENVFVSASQNGAVRATATLTLNAENLTASTSVTITTSSADVTLSPDPEWSFAAGIASSKNPKQEIMIAETAGAISDATIYVHYKPSSNVDGIHDVTVTATYTGAEDAETTVKVRCVEENFVIAAKVAGSWYALPADMTGSAAVREAVMIDVDETNKVAYGPLTLGYKMWPVKTVNSDQNRFEDYGDRVRFAGNSDKGLINYSGNNKLNNNAVIDGIDDGAAATIADYEWTIATTDCETYTLHSNLNSNYLDIYRPVEGNFAGKLVWATNGTYETKDIRFFPLHERAIIDIIAREWKTNGLVFSVAADNRITAASYKIGNGEETVTTYTRHSTGGYGLYEVVLPSLLDHYGKVLTLKLTIDGTPTYATVRIPIIVNEDKSTKTSEPFATLDLESKNYDVVVLRGATLTTNASNTEAFKFGNLYIYAGAKLVNSTNGYLNLNYLELRGGIIGIDAKSSLTQDVPRLMLGKAIAGCTYGANLDMIVNTAHSYALSVPFDVSLANVNFANFLNPSTGEAVSGMLDQQFLIMEYDGEQRASTGKGWKHVTSTSRVLHPGEGYVLQGKRPKGQPFAVIRFPLSLVTAVTGWATSSGEIEKDPIDITAYNGGSGTPDNDKGWNLIANPYMAPLSYNGADEGYAANFTVGNLVKSPDDEHWDGSYKWVNDENAYVTIPNETYTAFPQYRANSANAIYKPFMNFFIQVATDGSVEFDRSLRDMSKMPRYLMPAEKKASPVYVDIDLTHGADVAQAGITIKENATPGYKFGEDQNMMEQPDALTYLKSYTIADGHYLVGNTLTPSEANSLIPLEFYAPNTESEYVFSLSGTTDVDKLDYVILYDEVESINTNLMQYNYNFNLSESGLVKNRFYISLKLKEESTSTDIEEVVTGKEDSDKPLKFLYRGQIYILNNGVIYDATGKRVREVNK